MPSLTYQQAKQQLDERGQGHVLRFWKELTREQRCGLLDQVAALDWDGIGRMRQALTDRRGPAAPLPMQPAEVMELAGAERREAVARGEALLRGGQVGVILVAGGQGSRLGFNGPKGAFAIGPVSGCTLFEIHCRKVLALERKYGAHVPLYVMTSQANHRATADFLAQHRHFGLDAGRVHLFPQAMWPALDAGGRVLMETRESIFMSPDGHGGVLQALSVNGLLDDMKRRGVTTLFYFQVDNPLVEVGDPAFVGLHVLRGAAMSLKVCAKRDPDEGLGVVVERGGRRAVVEYTELTPEQKRATRGDGRLLFLYGSVALHVFSRDFLIREAALDLPLHLAHKKVPCIDDSGSPCTPREPNAFKFERFIFDVLPDAERSVNLAFDREDEFAPVKNAAGSDSPETSRGALIAKFSRWLDACGVKVPRAAGGAPLHAVEIDPCYALTPLDLARKLPEGFALSGPVCLREPD